MTIDLFSLMTITKGEMLKQGGAFVEVLNESEDGVAYVPISMAEQATETTLQQEQGAQQ